MLQRNQSAGGNLTLLLGSLPGLVAVAIVALAPSVPTFTLLAITAIAYGAWFAGMSEQERAETSLANSTNAVQPELLLMDSLPYVPAQTHIRAVAATGICPLGFRTGSEWTAFSNGHLSRPLCRPAVKSIASHLQPYAVVTSGTKVSCQCPFADRDVVFALETVAA